MRKSVIGALAAIALTAGAVGMAIKRNMKEKAKETKDAARKAVAKVKKTTRTARHATA